MVYEAHVGYRKINTTKSSESIKKARPQTGRAFLPLFVSQNQHFTKPMPSSHGESRLLGIPRNSAESRLFRSNPWRNTGPR